MTCLGFKTWKNWNLSVWTWDFIGKTFSHKVFQELKVGFHEIYSRCSCRERILCFGEPMTFFMATPLGQYFCLNIEIRWSNCLGIFIILPRWQTLSFLEAPWPFLLFQPKAKMSTLCSHPPKTINTLMTPEPACGVINRGNNSQYCL